MPDRYPDTAKNLEIMAEECSEIVLELIGTLARIQRLKSKIIRFGLKDFHPCNSLPNQQALGIEIGHLTAMIDCLVRHGVVLQSDITTGRQQKLENLGQWYSGATIDPEKERLASIVARSKGLV